MKHFQLVHQCVTPWVNSHLLVSFHWLMLLLKLFEQHSIIPIMLNYSFKVKLPFHCTYKDIHGIHGLSKPANSVPASPGPLLDADGSSAPPAARTSSPSAPPAALFCSGSRGASVRCRLYNGTYPGSVSATFPPAPEAALPSAGTGH